MQRRLFQDNLAEDPHLNPLFDTSNLEHVINSDLELNSFLEEDALVPTAAPTESRRSSAQIKEVREEVQKLTRPKAISYQPEVSLEELLQFYNSVSILPSDGANNRISERKEEEEVEVGDENCASKRSMNRGSVVQTKRDVEIRSNMRSSSKKT